VTLVTLYGGILNALHRFAAAAAAPILLNLAMMMTLALVAFVPTAGHAAAWGVLLAGVLEFALVAGDASRAGVLPRFRWPDFDADVKKFFRALGPSTLGSAGVQLALFADTIIASFLAAGALSALYYADRLNQLPIGVIGIAAGTVVLPEMARRIAAGDEAGARRAQNHAIELTLLLSVPCVVAFLIVPEPIIRALFARGAFTSADAVAAGQTLAAYALGLIPFVLIRSVVATFFARGDTANPVKASLAAALINIAFKVLLVGSLAQVGLALATSIGAWVNLVLVLWLAKRRALFVLDPGLRRAMVKIAAAGLALAVALWGTQIFVAHLVHDGFAFGDEGRLLVLVAIGAVVYGGVIVTLFGRRWLEAFRRVTGSPL
jgi:putative peptidoglycan lipid II flippase